MTLAQGLKVLDLARRMISGDVVDKVQAARELVALAIDMVPVEDLQQYLTDAARIRADRVADIAEQARLADEALQAIGDEIAKR